MEFTAFEQVFKEKKINFKKINSSPVGEFARGETYMFALFNDIHLPKSVGYASTTPTEIVMLYTSEGLSLYNESTEKWMFEVLCRENMKLSFGIWIFTKREMKFQIMYRTTLKNLIPLDKVELESIIQATKQEYTQFGKRLKESLQNPRPEGIVCIQKSTSHGSCLSKSLQSTNDRVRTQKSKSRRELISLLLSAFQGVKRSETEYDIFRTIAVSQHAPSQLNKFKGFVTLTPSSFVLQLFAEVCVLQQGADEVVRGAKWEVIEQHSRNIEKCLNSDAQEQSELMEYSRARKKFVYRTESDFGTENVADHFSRVFKASARKLCRRTVLVNTHLWHISNLTKTTFQAEQPSAVTTMYDERLLAVAKHWKDSGYLTCEMKAELGLFAQETDPLFALSHPLGLHLQCLIYELLLKNQTEELITIDSDANLIRHKYDCRIQDIDFSQVKLASLESALLPQVKLLPESFRNAGSKGETYDTEETETRVRESTAIGDNTDLWSITKSLFPVVISSVLPRSVTPKLVGFVNRSNSLRAIEVRYQSLLEVKLLEEEKQRFLLQLATGLMHMHRRGAYHLLLCPANIGLTHGRAPVLCNAKVCGLTLPSLDAVSDDSQLHFLAPEVFRLMDKVQKSRRPKVCHYQHISGAADVYSFGVVMRWLLAPQSPEAPLDRWTLRDEVVKRKRRPQVPADFEEREPALTDLMHRCWARRRFRPDIHQVVKALQNTSHQ